MVIWQRSQFRHSQGFARVIEMNRRLGGDASLNAPIRGDGDAGERQDWLVDDSPSQEGILVKNEELENRRQALIQALSGLNARERRIFEARRLAETRSRCMCQPCVEIDKRVERLPTLAADGACRFRPAFSSQIVLGLKRLDWPRQARGLSFRLLVS